MKLILITVFLSYLVSLNSTSINKFPIYETPEIRRHDSVLNFIMIAITKL